MSSSQSDGCWLARHVYIPHSRHTRYLCEVVQPNLDAAGIGQYFFFLRYWQGGPHLRLRILCGPSAVGVDAAERFFDELEREPTHFSAAECEEYALGVGAQEELARLEGETVREPVALGTHRRAFYEPEWEKYGGVAGVAIAEGVFRTTSTIAIRMLQDARARNSAANCPPLGEALKVMALSLSGAGLGRDEAVDFLERYRAWWRHYTTSENEIAWPELYRRLSTQVVALCRGAWGADAASEPLHHMISDATAHARMVSGGYPDTPIQDVVLEGTHFLDCLSNYVHTTNNRLGMAPSGEGLVADLLLRGLQDAGPLQRHRDEGNIR